jgi:predicted N-acetyltransferase YhbS
MRICPLADRPDAIPLLAGWFHSEWSSFDGRSVTMVEAQLAENLKRESIPITFLALVGATVIGTVSLDESDLPSHYHLSPWLASLFVAPEARERGIATALVRYALDFAALQKIPSLYLWTPGPTRLYERCRWIEIERTEYASCPITVMRSDT